MPIFEYACEGCSHKFEKLVFNDHTEVACPKCEGTKLRKLFSVFASISSSSSPEGCFNPGMMGGMGCEGGGCQNPGMCGM